MLKRKVSHILTLTLIFNLTFAAMCNKSSDPARTLAKAADDFAEGQKSAAKLLANAKTSGLVSGEDINEIKPFLQQANALNDQIIVLGKAFLVDPTNQTDKQKLIATINLVSAALVRANEAGLTRIRDANTRTAFSAIIVSLQAAATSVVVVLGKG